MEMMLMCMGELYQWLFGCSGVCVGFWICVCVCGFWQFFEEFGWWCYDDVICCYVDGWYDGGDEWYYDFVVFGFDDEEVLCGEVFYLYDVVDDFVFVDYVEVYELVVELCVFFDFVDVLVDLEDCFDQVFCCIMIIDVLEEDDGIVVYYVVFVNGQIFVVLWRCFWYL